MPVPIQGRPTSRGEGSKKGHVLAQGPVLRPEYCLEGGVPALSLLEPEVLPGDSFRPPSNFAQSRRVTHGRYVDALFPEPPRVDETTPEAFGQHAYDRAPAVPRLVPSDRTRGLVCQARHYRAAA